MFAWHTHTHTMGTGRWAWLLLARLANNRSGQSVFAYILLRDSRRQRAIVAIAVFTRHIVLCMIICANVLLLLLYSLYKLRGVRQTRSYYCFENVSDKQTIEYTMITSSSLRWYRNVRGTYFFSSTPDKTKRLCIIVILLWSPANI